MDHEDPLVSVLLLLVLPLFFANIVTIVVFLSILLLFALSGRLAAGSLFQEISNPLELWILGMVLGLCSNVIIFIFMRVWGFGGILLLLSLNIALIASYGVFRLRGRSWWGAVQEAFSSIGIPRKIGILFACLLIAIVATYFAFGKNVPNGYAYKDLHSTDTLHHMSMISELRKSVPPKNMYFSNDTLHYYWLAQVFPGMVYSLDGRADIRDLSRLTNYFYTLSFLFLSFVFLNNTLKHDSNTTLFTLLITFFASSYKDLFVLFKVLVRNFPAGVARSLHLDALLIDSYGQAYTNYSHGWFRSFMVEPQCTLALLLILTSVYLVIRYSLLPDRPPVCLALGTITGLTVGVDAFMGLIFGAIFAIGLTIHLVQKIVRRELGSGAWKSLASLAVPPLLIFTLLFRLEMFKFGETYLSVSPDMIILVASIPYLVMDFGPLFLLAAFSILSFHLGKAESYAYNNKNLLHIMIVTCLIFMFFINVKGVGSTQVLRKGGYILRIPLMMLAAVSVQNLLWKENWKGTLRQVRTGTIVLAVLVATSVPSILIDIYTINDAAQVRPTEIVSPAEMEAYRWIRSNTDERDIVQGVNTDITGVVAFAERRTFLGDWEHARMFQVGARRVAERHDGVLNGILQGTEASEVAKNLRRFGIKYLMLKDNFNQKMTFTLNQLKRAGDMFRTVYEKDGVFIFQVVNGSSSMESRKNRR